MPLTPDDLAGPSGGHLSPGALTTTPSAPAGGLDKLLSFGLSTVESFPEMFGIEPSQATQAYRIANPIGGFVSQAAGALVPYVGEAKLLRMVPQIGAGIEAARAIGLARGPALGAALELGTEAGAVGIANTALAATPLPAALYQGVTGQEPETAPIGDVALGNAFNTVAAAGLGGVGGLIAKRFAVGQRLTDFVPGFHEDETPVPQMRALDAAIQAHSDPTNDFTLNDDQLSKATRAYAALHSMNLQDKVPSFTSDGTPTETPGVAGPVRWSDLGKVYRSIVDERKGREIPTFLNNASQIRNNPDNVVQAQRLIVDPVSGFQSDGELQNAVDRIGVSGEVLGSQAQDLRVITVRDGTGYQPMPAATAETPAAEFDLGDLGEPAPKPADEIASETAPSDLLPAHWDKTTGAVQEGIKGELNRRDAAEAATAIGRRLLSSEPEFLQKATASFAQKRANGIQRRFTAAPFRAVGDGFRMAQDVDGMYVFAKKIVGDISKPAPGDSWAFFRTDRPELFAPEAARTDKMVMDSAYWPTRDQRLTTGEKLFDRGNDYRALIDGDSVLTKDVRQRGPIRALIRDSAKTLARYAAPSGSLFESNPIANKAWQLSKLLEHHAELGVNAIMNGRISLNRNAGVLKNTILSPQHAPGVRAMLRTFNPQDLSDIKEVVEASVPFEQVQELHAAGHLTDNAHNFLAYMQMLSDGFVDRYGKVSEHVMGNDAMKLLADFQARQGHYMLTRQYPGAYKVLLHNEDQGLAGWATGHSPLEARQAAELIQKEQAEKGKTILQGGLIDGSTVDPDLFDRMRKSVMKPGFLKNRGDMIGYEFARGDLTSKKLGDLVEKNLRNRESYLRDIAIAEHTADYVESLRRTDPQMAQAFLAARDRMRGDEGPWAAQQNSFADKALHAVGLSGKDSASNIVKGTQKMMSAFQFGFNLSQPIQNMVGMMQTILPEIAYVLHAPDHILSRNYVSVPLLNSSNHVMGVMGKLSTLKLLKNSFDRFTVPLGQQPESYQQLLADMVDLRIINGRMTEEQFGSDGYILAHPRAAFKEGHSVLDVMKAGSTILMTKSEEVNRTMAMNVAYEIGTMRGFSPDRMRLFAQEFIHKTQYSYATHDRAAIFTTPIGSLGGTFKNWMFHYLGSMIKYSTAGKAGMQALAWQTAVTGLVGGAAAAPLVVPLANAASKFFSDKSAMQNLYDAAANVGAPEWVADGVMYGLPGSLGLSLSSQVASPASDPIRDSSMLWDFAAFDRMKALSAGTKDALVAYKTLGQNPFQNTIVRDELARALAPRMMYRAMAIGQSGAIRSMSTGYDVAKLGLGGAALYVAGFNPTELDKTYQVYSDIRDNQAQKKQMIQQLGEGLAQAWQDGDDRLSTRIYARALAIGVDMSSVLRSAQSRQLRGQQTQLEYAASPQDKEDYSFEFNNDGQP